MSVQPTIAIVGQGRVGSALTRRLTAAGLVVTCIDRQSYPEWFNQPQTDVVILALHEHHLFAVATDPQAQAHCSSSLVVHVHGLSGPDVIAELSPRAAAAHPFQTFGVDDPAMLDGIAWGVELSASCTHDDWVVLSDLLQRIDGRPVRLPAMTTQSRMRYHASAVAASNVVYAAYALARELARDVNIDPSTFLVPIIQQTTRNAVQAIEQHEPFAITGPMARGDVRAVIEQLEALPESLQPLYRHLAMALLEALGEHLSEEQRIQLRRVLLEEMR
ncbi:MAG: DUF2520 domain-containing protein [Candidatus Kapaibacteriota bacterium]